MNACTLKALNPKNVKPCVHLDDLANLEVWLAVLATRMTGGGHQYAGGWTQAEACTPPTRYGPSLLAGRLHGRGTACEFTWDLVPPTPFVIFLVRKLICNILANRSFNLITYGLPCFYSK